MKIDKSKPNYLICKPEPNQTKPNKTKRKLRKSNQNNSE